MVAFGMIFESKSTLVLVSTGSFFYNNSVADDRKKAVNMLSVTLKIMTLWYKCKNFEKKLTIY